ncbi:hypothetical protein MED01_002358 [Micromonospora sp. MED01]|uniref:hypothetical protein n=1 Tax=Micromonospora alfalfae TaxID=2911212 RepID=UPI001EE862D9|nr:hypothetical protein [Micromonospora alfalfae]MCG5464193.1 hypothetical protein [Micromonospora alfalfae]
MSDGQNAGQRLVTALMVAGFTTAGVGRGHVRMGWPGSPPRRGSLLVPVDDTAPEFADALDAVKADLLAVARRGEAARYALDLHAMEVDQ